MLGQYRRTSRSVCDVCEDNDDDDDDDSWLRHDSSIFTCFTVLIIFYLFIEYFTRISFILLLRSVINYVGVYWLIINLSYLFKTNALL